MKPARHRICRSYCCRAHRRGNHAEPDNHFLRQPLNVALDEVGRGLVSYPGRLRRCVVRPELWIYLCEVSVGVRHGGLDLLHDVRERVLVGCLQSFEDSLVDHLTDTKKKAVTYVHPFILAVFYQLVYRFSDKYHILRCQKFTNYRFRKTGWRFSVGFVPEIEGKNGELDLSLIHI